MAQGTGSGSSPAINLDAIAVAVASAIEQSLNTSVPQQGNRSDGSPIPGESISSQLAATSLQPPTMYDRASGLTNPPQK